jgi:hypothetical protein
MRRFHTDYWLHLASTRVSLGLRPIAACSHCTDFKGQEKQMVDGTTELMVTDVVISDLVTSLQLAESNPSTRCCCPRPCPELASRDVVRLDRRVVSAERRTAVLQFVRCGSRLPCDRSALCDPRLGAHRGHGQPIRSRDLRTRRPPYEVRASGFPATIPDRPSRQDRGRDFRGRGRR